LEEKWEMLRWITEFIEENDKEWMTNKEKRQEEEKRSTPNWEKIKRLEKVDTMKEKYRKDIEEEGKENIPVEKEKEDKEKRKLKAGEKRQAWSWKKREKEKIDSDDEEQETNLRVSCFPPSDDKALNKTKIKKPRKLPSWMTTPNAPSTAPEAKFMGREGKDDIEERLHTQKLRLKMRTMKTINNPTRQPQNEKTTSEDNPKQEEMTRRKHLMSGTAPEKVRKIEKPEDKSSQGKGKETIGRKKTPLKDDLNKEKKTAYVSTVPDKNEKGDKLIKIDSYFVKVKNDDNRPEAVQTMTIASIKKTKQKLKCGTVPEENLV
jgi:hypothetical protein